MSALHRAVTGFPLRRENSMGAATWQPLFERCGRDLDRIAPGLQRDLARGLDGVLPFWNLMLDLPAAALSLAALAAASSDNPSWRRALGAGLLVGLAIQTKYSALATLPVLLAWGVANRSPARMVAAALLAVTLAAAWECWLVARYGDSHFLLNARLDAIDYPPAVQLLRKLAFAGPHLCYLGGLGWVWGLLGLRAAGAPRWLAAWLAVVATGGIARVLLVPPEWGNPGEEPSALPRLAATTDFFAALGVLTLAGVGAAALAPLWSWRTGFRTPTPARRLGWLLLAWWLAEAAGVVALSPFPAGRRLVVLSVVTGLIVCRAVVLSWRLDRTRRLGSWLLPLGVAYGLGVAAFDTYDAWAEPAVLRRALELAEVRAPGARVWTLGHWGWQEWAHRRGVRLILPGSSRLEPGDVVVEPVSPATDPDELFRPAVRRAAVEFGPGDIEWFAEAAFDDAVPGQTLPALYGGDGPLFGRCYPRLRARVGVVRRSFVAEPVYPPPP